MFEVGDHAAQAPAGFPAAQEEGREKAGRRQEELERNGGEEKVGRPINV